MTRPQIATLLFIGAMFGASFLYMRIASPVVGPWVVAFVRLGLAAVVLAAFARRTRLRTVARRWRTFLFLGFINAALPFSMFAFAETTLTASMGAILNAMTPMAMALAGVAWLGQPLSGRRMVGIAVGIGGVATIVGLGPITVDGPHIAAMAACLVAITGYAIGFTYVRRNLHDVDPLTISLGEALPGAILVAPAAIVTLPTAPPSVDVLAAMAALAIFSTALAWPLLFRLVASIGPTASSTVTFVAPVFGITWGALLLHEPIDPSLAFGAAAVLVSIAIIVGARIPRPGPLVVETLWTTSSRRLANLQSRG